VPDAKLDVGTADLPLSSASSFGARSLRRLNRTELRAGWVGLAVVGGLAAGWIGYRAGADLRGTSGGQAALLWTAIVVSGIAMALYAWESRQHERLGRLIVALGLLAVLALLQASRAAFAFSLGWLLAGLAVPLLCYAMLSHATGRPRLRGEQRLIIGGSFVVAVCWCTLALSTRQPTLIAPLIRCAPGCPRNVFFLGSLSGSALDPIQVALRLAWVVLALGVVVSLGLRWRAAGAADRRRSGPVLVPAVLFALALTVSLALQAADGGMSASLGWISLVAAATVPVAMLLGLTWERLFMGEALEEFVNSLGDADETDVGTLMAEALRDPSLRIAYATPATGTYADSSRARLDLPPPATDSGVTPVERDSRTAAFVIRDGALPDQERFIRAAGTAALISLENSQLDADLSATVVELAASRRRLVESANAVRQRIERDLHDGIQQHIVGMRVKLEVARAAIDEAPEQGQRMLAEIGREMDDALEDLRSIAQGVYPALLTEYGLGEALRSAARRSPGAVSVRASRLGRYPLDVESAVYFCCVEALQNVAKHAGPQATATVRLWEDAPVLRFETVDSGVGFAPDVATPGNGLISMRDRVAAVGGDLTVTSSVGRGTMISGCVPIGEPRQERRADAEDRTSGAGGGDERIADPHGRP